MNISKVWGFEYFCCQQLWDIYYYHHFLQEGLVLHCHRSCLWFKHTTKIHNHTLIHAHPACCRYGDCYRPGLPGTGLRCGVACGSYWRARELHICGAVCEAGQASGRGWVVVQYNKSLHRPFRSCTLSWIGARAFFGCLLSWGRWHHRGWGSSL